MAELTIDKVYAKALYQVAQEMNIEKKVKIYKLYTRSFKARAKKISGARVPNF